MNYYFMCCYLLKVCANHYPHLFGTTFRWANEIQLLFDITLQNYYLQKYGTDKIIELLKIEIWL